MKIWISRLFLFLAILITGYLLLASLSQSPLAGCDGGSDCQQVLSSEWSRIGPVPVSLPALFLYSFLFISTWLPAHRFYLTRQTLGFAGLLGIGWFLFLQLFLLRLICPFCMASHLAGAVGITTLLYFRLPPAVQEGRLSGPIFLPASLGGLLLTLLITLQVTLPQPATHRSFEFEEAISERKPADKPPPEITPVETPEASIPELVTELPVPAQEDSPPLKTSEAKSTEGSDLPPPSPPSSSLDFEATVLSLHQGAFQVSTATDPYLGDPESENVMVSLYDYTCSHCRETHHTLRKTLERLEYDLAVILVAVPLNRHCNPEVSKAPPPGRPLACEYARLALAVFNHDPEAFSKFDLWLFSDQSPVFTDLKTGPDKARLYAEGLVGKSNLETALADPWIDRQLKKNIGIYAANNEKTGRVGLPQQIIGSSINLGTLKYSFDLMLLLNRHLNPSLNPPP